MREGEKDGKRERRSVCVRERDRARESDDGERRGEEKRGEERRNLLDGLIKLMLQWPNLTAVLAGRERESEREREREGERGREREGVRGREREKKRERGSEREGERLLHLMKCHTSTRDKEGDRERMR